MEETQKNNPSLECDTYIDTFIQSSSSNQEFFEGIHRITMSAIILYSLLTSYYNLVTFGYLIKLETIYYAFDYLKFAFIVWGFFHLWSYNGFVLQIMILQNYSQLLCTVYKYIIQLFLFIFTSFFLYFNHNMYLSNRLFILLMFFIHLSKLHTYIQANSYYRSDYLECRAIDCKPHSIYPNNITFKQFFYFLIAPVMLYQIDYPLNRKLRFNYFINKVAMTFALICLMHYDYSEYIKGVLFELDKKTIMELINKLVLPVNVILVLGLVMITQFLLPAYAELTLFSVRQFGEDWWNATRLYMVFEKFNTQMFSLINDYLKTLRDLLKTSLITTILVLSVPSFFVEYYYFLLFHSFKPYFSFFVLCHILLCFVDYHYFRDFKYSKYLFWISILFSNTLLFILYNK